MNFVLAILLDLLPSQASLAALHILLLDLLNHLRLTVDSHHPTDNPRWDPPTNDIVRQTTSANVPCPAWPLRHQRIEDTIVQPVIDGTSMFPSLKCDKLTSCCFSSADSDEVKPSKAPYTVLSSAWPGSFKAGVTEGVSKSTLALCWVTCIGPFFRADIGDAGRRPLGIRDEDKASKVKSMRIRAFKRHMLSLQQVPKPRHLILRSEGIRQIHLQRQQVDPRLRADIVSRYKALVSGFATAPAMTTTSVLAPLVLRFARLFFLPSLLFTNTKAPIDPVTRKATAAACCRRREAFRWGWWTGGKGRVGWHPFPKLAGDLLEVSLYVVGDGVELLARVIEELLGCRTARGRYRNIIKHESSHFNSAIAKSTSKVDSKTNRESVHPSSQGTGEARYSSFRSYSSSPALSFSRAAKALRTSSLSERSSSALPAQQETSRVDVESLTVTLCIPWPRGTRSSGRRDDLVRLTSRDLARWRYDRAHAEVRPRVFYVACSVGERHPFQEHLHARLLLRSCSLKRIPECSDISIEHGYSFWTDPIHVRMSRFRIGDEDRRPSSNESSASPCRTNGQTRLSREAVRSLARRKLISRWRRRWPWSWQPCIVWIFHSKCGLSAGGQKSSQDLLHRSHTCWIGTVVIFAKGVCRFHVGFGRDRLWRGSLEGCGKVIIAIVYLGP
ncbi:hypothetical protein KC349_g28 [Hortaea werneckii]|nr:hypothetical protein KC349_g28 [Hortaea werneckii]